MQDARSLLRFARYMVSTLRWRLVVLLAFGLISSVTAGIGIVVLVPLLGIVGVETGGGTTEPIVRYVEGALAFLGLAPTAPILLGFNAGLLIVMGGLRRLQSVVEARIYEDFVHQERVRLFEALVATNWRQLVSEKSSSHLHLLTKEVDRIGTIASGIVSLITRSLMALVYLGVAVVVSPTLTLLVAATGALLTVLSAPLAGRAKQRGTEVSKSYRELYGVVSEHLAGLKTVKAHGAEAFSTRTFGARSSDAANAGVEVVRNHGNVGFLLQSGSAIALSIIVLVALNLPSLTPAGLLLLLYLFTRLVPMLTDLQRSYQSLLARLPAMELVQESLDKFAGGREASSGGVIRPVRDSIRLQGVTFSYTPGVETLKGIDLVIPAGRTTALVGPSGGGKSTLADLLIGLLEPSTGTMLLDGDPLTTELRPAWRSQVAYVAQDVFLFHDTIRENLRLSDHDADDDAIWEALDSASAGFVRSLPQGLDTVVGDRGARLSGGERQRLALARALLRKPYLLVLDEATSNLDSVNEVRVQEAIQSLHGRVTLLVIAHRLSTVRTADCIHVMDDGHLVESGTWDDLNSRQSGTLRELAAAQGLVA